MSTLDGFYSKTVGMWITISNLKELSKGIDTDTEMRLFESKYNNYPT